MILSLVNNFFRQTQMQCIYKNISFTHVNSQRLYECELILMFKDKLSDVYGIEMNFIISRIVAK